MDCKYCDYYSELNTKSNGGGKNACVCQFTNYMFTEDIEMSDMEYPCKNVSYQDYLRSANQRSDVKKEYALVKKYKHLE
jgi:hypothetical protein